MNFLKYPMFKVPNILAWVMGCSSETTIDSEGKFYAEVPPQFETIVCSLRLKTAGLRRLAADAASIEP